MRLASGKGFMAQHWAFISISISPFARKFQKSSATHVLECICKLERVKWHSIESPYQYKFHLLPQCFQKSSAVDVQECICKWERVYCTALSLHININFSFCQNVLKIVFYTCVRMRLQVGKDLWRSIASSYQFIHHQLNFLVCYLFRKWFIYCLLWLCYILHSW